MEKTIWYSVEVKKPNNLAKVEWKLNTELDEQNTNYQGLYIEQEDMFFVGFEDSSEEFYFSWGVAYWRYL